LAKDGRAIAYALQDLDGVSAPALLEHPPHAVLGSGWPKHADVSSPHRIAILWQQLSSHASACFRALRAEGAEVMLVHRTATSDAPFDDGYLRTGLEGDSWTEAPDEGTLRLALDEFAPDALLVASWNIGAYRRLSLAMRGRTLRILCMDNPWLGTAKQWVGRIASRSVVRPAYDVAFVPGERQAEFARHLGFDDTRILWGLYCCDTAFVRDEPVLHPPNRFIFVGRLIQSKGVDALAAAYRSYHAINDDPWPLLVCGTGPLASELACIEGVELRGFVQPLDLPTAFREAGCLVLASRFEPWGVVIHEACSSGLAVIASTACGASTRLLLDGYNGFLIAPGDERALADSLCRMNHLTLDARREMAVASTSLARQFTPPRWAAQLLDRLPSLRRQSGLQRS
jgi:glycosyltransferase involved in cell wall biosynthesis